MENLTEAHMSAERHRDDIYRPTNLGVTRLTQFGLSPEEAENFILSRIEETDFDPNGKRTFYVRNGRMEKFDVDHWDTTDHDKFTYWHNVKGDGQIIVLKEYKNRNGKVDEVNVKLFTILTNHPANMETTVKEGMVVACWELTEINDFIDDNDEADYNRIVNLLNTKIDTLQSSGLSKGTIQDMKRWLSYNAVYSSRSANKINDKLSIALSLRETFSPKDWFLDRDTLLPEIKSTCASYFKLTPDKYTPSDIAMIRKSDKGNVIPLINDIIAKHKDKFDVANLIQFHVFINHESEDYTSDNNPCYLISLKEGIALGGKAKSYLKLKVAYAKDKFNLLDTEQEWDSERAKKERDKMEDAVKKMVKEDSDIYKFGPTPKVYRNIESNYNVQYGALKILRFLMSQGHQFIVNTGMYAMAVFAGDVDVVPPFFKWEGDGGKREGSFPLMLKESESFDLVYEDGIEIVISQVGKGGIKLFFSVVTDERLYELLLEIRSNTTNTKQLTMEITKSTVLNRNY